MALTALLNLVDTLNPATAQTQGAATLQAAPAAQPLAQTAPNLANANGAEPQDLFVASNQDPVAQATADAAGLFTVAQPAAFTPAAGALLAQPNPLAENLGGANVTPAVATTDAPQAPAPATGAGNATGAVATGNGALGATPGDNAPGAVASGTNAAGNNVATAAGADATAANAAGTTPAGVNPTAATGGAVDAKATAANAASTAGTGAPAGVNTTTTTANATASTSAGTATVQDQLQALNSALEALGLSAADISQIDRIATQSNDFSPTAYSSLACQLIAQAQNAAPPTTLTAANATTGAPTGTAPGATGVKTAAG